MNENFIITFNVISVVGVIVASIVAFNSKFNTTPFWCSVVIGALFFAHLAYRGIIKFK